ncbi:HelD family protein [Actinomadura scrupuli]|uniref:HelD family protein n=1 Tax=Actinomadura scrupuli TaxID=559629 RepID=UPI003D99F3AB
MSAEEFQREQAYVGMLYGRLDGLRERTAARLAGTLADPGASAQARVEREVSVSALAERAARLEAAENGLCFGRLDLRDGGRRYIGRINVMDDSDDGEPLLLDWRAPAARPFYVATSAAPEGVRRRRHITTRHRRVIGLDDEVLDGEGLADPDGLVGEAALLAALNTGRTGRMGDIVATLQAEQDAIIRSDHRGVLVVQGGPGTGKTVVALHRAAYLLYTHQRLAARGVLVVGPNAAFLSYIGQVLPGLGETNVLLSTVGALYPGVSADRDEPAATAEIKGRAVMARVLAAAVAARQGAVTGPVDVEVGEETLRLEPEVCARAAERARASRLPHNQARRLFAREIVAVLAGESADLTRRLADRLEDDLAQVLDETELAALRAMPDDDGLPAFVDPDGMPPDPIGGPQEVAALRRELWHEPGVHAALDRLWPELTPQRLLEELFADPARLAAVAPELTAAERRSLLRRPGGWSVADVPLLDEAAELLGEDDRERVSVADRRRAEQVAYAQGVLDIGTGSRSSDLEDDEAAELLTAADLMDARALADRHEIADHRSVAERAAADRSWTFGHVIVDEAQELSEMAWRSLMRRCPTRSMTVVGDIAQTGDPAGTTSWRRVLEPHVGDRWRLIRLSVNYRTPAEIMEVAAEVLSALDPGMRPPRSVRETGVAPWRLRTGGDLPAALAERAVSEAAALGEGAEGTLAVIVPEAGLGELGAAVRAALPQASYGSRPDLKSRVVVLGVRQAKGLEFDSVLLADPAAILTASPRGLNDLYVALTRATKRLGILHPGPLPSVLTRVVTHAGRAQQ